VSVCFTDSTLTRRLPPHYSDGVYAPSGKNRPNPRELSSVVTSGPSGLQSVNNKTALFVFFGKFQELLLDYIVPF